LDFTGDNGENRGYDFPADHQPTPRLRLASADKRGLDASKSATICVKKRLGTRQRHQLDGAATTVSAAINPVKMAARRAFVDQGTS
jgi:hypothetical protein